MSESSEIVARLDVARRAAREAGQLTMRYFDQSVDVERKSDNSPVTIADRQAEQLLREIIGDSFPDDGVLGEEFGEDSGTSGYRWILDPIDGTKSFITGVPIFGTLIGVEHGEECVIGIIELPALDQRVYAALGQHCWWQRGDSTPMQTRVSNVDRLGDGVYLTSEVKTFADRNALHVHERLEAASWYARTWGDCYGYFLLVTGRAVAMIDPIVSLWDAAALYPVLKEAGATMTDWDGNESYRAGEIIATNGHVFDEVLAIVRDRS